MLLAHDGATLRLATTDLEVRAEVTIPCEQSTGSFTLAAPAALLYTFLKGKKGTVTLTLHGDRLDVTAGGATTSLATLPAQEFPAKGKATTLLSTTADFSAFRSALVRVAPLASKEDARGAVLMGTLIDFANRRIVATDGYALIMEPLAVGHVSDARTKRDDRDAEFILPATATTALKAIKLPKGTNPTVHIVMAESDKRTLCELTFTTGDTAYAITTRLVTGRYPNADSVRPGAPYYVASVDRKTLAAVLTSAKTVVDRDRFAIFHFDGDIGDPTSQQLTITADDSYKGSAFKADVPIAGIRTNGRLTIGLKPALVITALAALDADRVTIALVSPLSAITISDGTRECIVMPVRL